MLSSPSLSSRRGAGLKSALLVAVAASALAATPALADATATGDDTTGSQSTSTPPVITVTASRRSASVTDVPSAINVLSAQTLKNYNVDSLQDIGKVDPSLSLQTYGAAQQTLIIRGVASTVGQTTGMYLDESPLLGGYSTNVRGDGTPSLRLHDVERVEVLKGPQGTLFGAGSMAGTLRVITAQPDLYDFSGNVHADVGAVNGGNATFKGDGMINLPVIKDRLALRAVIWTEQGGGYIDWQGLDRTTRNVNDTHMFGGRLTAKLQATDNLDIVASVNHQKTQVDGTQAFLVSAGAYNAPFDTNEIYLDNYNLYNVTATWKTGIGDFIAIGSHGDKKTTSPHDTSPTAATKGITYPASFVGDLHYKDTTAELRYVSHFQAPIQVVAGGYYQHDTNDYKGATILTGDDGNLPCYTETQCAAAGLVNAGSNLSGTLNNSVLYANAVNTKIDQYAVYGQADLDILSNLTLTAGIRYLTADLDMATYGVQDISSTCGWVQGCVTTPYQSFAGKSSQSKTTYNFALLWKATPDISLYARAASGFRLGGINSSYYAAAAYGDSGMPLQYSPDSLWNYEGGVKAWLLDHKLYLTASYYHIDWTNQQLQAQTSTAFTYTLNAGRTKTDGVEVTAQVYPMDGLTLSGAVNYVDARLAEDLPEAIALTGNAGYKGDTIPYSPHWTGSAQARYEWAMGDTVKPYVQGSLTYRDKTKTTFNTSNTYYMELPSYVMIDLKAGASFDRYEVAVYADNVTNKTAWMGAYNSLDGEKVYAAMPAHYGVQFNVKF